MGLPVPIGSLAWQRVGAGVGMARRPRRWMGGGKSL